MGGGVHSVQRIRNKMILGYSVSLGWAGGPQGQEPFNTSDL